MFFDIFYWEAVSPQLFNNINYNFIFGMTVVKKSWHQTGDWRVAGSNPDTSIGNL